MTTTDTYPTHYAYPLVTWRATILGAVVALVTALMLNLLGVSLGIAVLAFGPASGGATGVISLIWITVSNLIATGFGAWIAGRTTANPDHHGGTLQGIAVWAVTSLAVMYIAGASLAGAGIQATNAAIAVTQGSMVQGGRAQANGGASPQGSMAQDTNRLAEQADQNAPAIQDAMAKGAAATGAASFALFLAMVLGLVAAIIGARTGARHPSWADRPRYTVVDRRHPV